jgi:hypothetical protein
VISYRVIIDDGLNLFDASGIATSVWFGALIFGKSTQRKNQAGKNNHWALNFQN